MERVKRNRFSIRSSRLVFFISKALATLIAPVNASPLTTSNQPTASLAPSPSATAVDTNTESSRDGSFQVLADGTQDLAALVGIFATNSVERYAIDYNKGHLSSAVALLSLLGLLGYVRALVKLGMGSKACEDAGFDTTALRPIFGVSDADRLPANEIYEAHYIERQETDSEITWKRVRRTKHTLDSFALAQHRSWMSRENGPAGKGSQIVNVALDMSEQHFSALLNISRRLFLGFGFKYLQYSGIELFRSSLGDLLVLVVSLFCVGVTSCLVIPLRGTSRPTWSLYVATIGLFVPIVITSLAWAWVYAQEQLPWVGLDWNRGRHRIRHFAYIDSGHSYITLNVRVVEGHIRSGIRIASLMAALSAIAGYVLTTPSLYVE